MSTIDYYNVLFACRLASCHISPAAPSECSSTFRGRSWTMRSQQQCSTRVALASDWTAHHLQTLCYDARCCQRHCSGLCVRYGHPSVCTRRACPSALGRAWTLWRAKNKNPHGHQSVLCCWSEGMEQFTAINSWHSVCCNLQTPPKNLFIWHCL